MAAGVIVVANPTFTQQWRTGRGVREAAAPHLAGTIRHVQGTGANARVTVAFTGRPPATFVPAQLILI